MVIPECECSLNRKKPTKCRQQKMKCTDKYTMRQCLAQDEKEREKTITFMQWL